MHCSGRVARQQCCVSGCDAPLGICPSESRSSSRRGSSVMTVGMGPVCGRSGKQRPTPLSAPTPRPVAASSGARSLAFEEVLGEVHLLEPHERRVGRRDAATQVVVRHTEDLQALERRQRLGQRAWVSGRAGKQAGRRTVPVSATQTRGDWYGVRQRAQPGID